MSRCIILLYKAGLESFNNLSKSCALPVEEHNSNAGSLTPELRSLATKSRPAFVRTDTGYRCSEESSRLWSSPTWWPSTSLGPREHTEVCKVTVNWETQVYSLNHAHTHAHTHINTYLTCSLSIHPLMDTSWSHTLSIVNNPVTNVMYLFEIKLWVFQRTLLKSCFWRW